jgi:hypothetical protein
MDHDLLLANIISTVKTAKAFDLPVVHSTISVATGRGRATLPELAKLLDEDHRSTGHNERVGGRRDAGVVCRVGRIGQSLRGGVRVT